MKRRKWTLRWLGKWRKKPIHRGNASKYRYQKDIFILFCSFLPISSKIFIFKSWYLPVNFLFHLLKKIVIANWKNVERFWRITEVLFKLWFHFLIFQQQTSKEVLWQSLMRWIQECNGSHNFSGIKIQLFRARESWTKSPSQTAWLLQLNGIACFTMGYHGDQMEFLFREKLSITKKVLQELPRPEMKVDQNIWLDLRRLEIYQLIIVPDSL